MGPELARKLEDGVQKDYVAEIIFAWRIAGEEIQRCPSFQLAPLSVECPERVEKIDEDPMLDVRTEALAAIETSCD